MRHILRYLPLICIASLPSSVFAALGGNVEQVTHNNNQTVARTQVRVTPVNGYTIHEWMTDSGITVREFAAAQGIVFALTWSGPSLPDLEQLLGNYFPQFKQAMTERRSRGIRGPVVFEQNDLVVESTGRMRDYRGRAYAPSLLPPHVSIEEIQ